MPAAARQFDLLILGAGAAGLFAARLAGERGRRVAVLEHNAQPGRKILASGGGRCNFTNLECGPRHYLSRNPHFVKSALAQFRPEHFLEWLAAHGVKWREKTLGQLFLEASSRQLLDLLLRECAACGVEIVTGAGGVAVAGGGGGDFLVSTTRGEFRAGALLVASGGLSYPKLGATGLGYELARQYGLGVEPTRPALAPLVLGPSELGWTSLAGLSVEAEVRAGGQSFREMLLFTHRGLSGPAVLQASSYWREGEPLEVDFAPGKGDLLGDLLRPGGKKDRKALRQALGGHLPQRLAAQFSEAAAPARWTDAALVDVGRRLHGWRFQPCGSEGYARAEVTSGGVETAGLDSKTLEARSCPGLFFAGEVVDVTGWLGGYNLHWAWASAAAVARAL